MKAPEEIFIDRKTGEIIKPIGQFIHIDAIPYIRTDIANKEKEELMGLENAWSLKHILEKLIEASNILLHEKDYDGHGWELIDKAKEEAKKTLNLISKHTKK